MLNQRMMKRVILVGALHMVSPTKEPITIYPVLLQRKNLELGLVLQRLSRLYDVPKKKPRLWRSSKGKENQLLKGNLLVQESQLE
jgi:hypothetical protein